MSGATAVLVSDYRRGVIDQPTIDLVRDRAAHSGALATVDSQGDLFRFSGFAVVKANRDEAEQSLGVPLADDAAIASHGRRLLDSLDAQSVVVTRGSAGLSVVDAGGVLHVPATNLTEVYDVTGAGDTVIAVMTLALAAGGTVRESATLANVAAGLVVRRLGNATISRDDLLAALPHP
jgi:rfaE bifunctional protein kinase chain/domain